jgi:hypothetical protein
MIHSCDQPARKGERMSVIHTISRRSFLCTGASLLATGASFMVLPNGYAAPQRRSHNSVQTAGSGAQPIVEGEHHTNNETDECIRICQDCHALCTQMIRHCLRVGGRHAAPDHIRLMLDCAQICETTADYLMRESVFHDRMCGLCADVCRQCADSCQQLVADDQKVKPCVDLCRDCAGSCERMASKGAA